MDHKKTDFETPAPLESLIETLELLIAQGQAYEHIFPPENYAARAAISVLSEMARKALNEAETLAETLEPQGCVEAPFSRREMQVLQLAAHGMTNKEIAYRLTISERTVQFHMNSIFNKSGTSTRTEAVALAIHQKWLTEK